MPAAAAPLAQGQDRSKTTIHRLYSLGDIEIRAVAEQPGYVSFFGHASVTGKGYEMYGGPSSEYGGWIEYIEKNAFKKTLGMDPDVAFLINHGGMTLARTKAGTLQLREDSVGLAVSARLNTSVSIINDLVLLLKDGAMSEMSFAFRVIRQRWLTEDGKEVEWWDTSGVHRHIDEVSLQKGDVSVVNWGANPYTDAGVRSLDDVVRTVVEAGRLDPGDASRAMQRLQAAVANPGGWIDEQWRLRRQMWDRLRPPTPTARTSARPVAKRPVLDPHTDPRRWG